MVEINEVSTTVTAFGDSEMPLSPRTRRAIVEECLRAMRDEREHEQRVDAERRITSGVRDEQEGEA